MVSLGNDLRHLSRRVFSVFSFVCSVCFVVHPPCLKWFWKGCKPNFVCALAGGENHLSQQPVPETRFAFAEPGAGRSGVSYLALHPMGFSVPPRLRLERCALTAPFHPYPHLLRNAGGLIFCGTFRRKVFQLSARVYLRRNRSYAASRPAVFGLSSPGLRRKRSSALPKPKKIYKRLAGLTSGGVPKRNLLPRI